MNDQLIELLRGNRNKRISLETLRRFFRDVHPEHVSNPENDRMLLKMLLTLASEGVVALPAEGSWEKFGNPAMPKWVSLVPSTISPAVDWASVPWAPELGFWVELQPRQLVSARSINEFLLRRRGTLIPVPLNERSAEIFGDEKRLASLAWGDTLFGGKLPLATIGAFHVATPLPYRAASAPGRPVLILENHHSYWSFGEWNTEQKRYAAVVYGSGNEFAKSGVALDQVFAETGASGAEYLGDLDHAGLAIPADFDARRRELGKPGLVPAEEFYLWLLDHGVRQSLRETSRVVQIDRGLSWLPDRLRKEVRMLLEGQSRIAQECLSYEVLTREFRR